MRGKGSSPIITLGDAIQARDFKKIDDLIQKHRLDINATYTRSEFSHHKTSMPGGALGPIELVNPIAVYYDVTYAPLRDAFYREYPDFPMLVFLLKRGARVPYGLNLLNYNLGYLVEKLAKKEAVDLKKLESIYEFYILILAQGAKIKHDTLINLMKLRKFAASLISFQIEAAFLANELEENYLSFFNPFLQHTDVVKGMVKNLYEISKIQGEIKQDEFIRIKGQLQSLAIKTGGKLYRLLQRLMEDYNMKFEAHLPTSHERDVTQPPWIGPPRISLQASVLTASNAIGRGKSQIVDEKIRRVKTIEVLQDSDSKSLDQAIAEIKTVKGQLPTRQEMKSLSSIMVSMRNSLTTVEQEVKTHHKQLEILNKKLDSSPESEAEMRIIHANQNLLKFYGMIKMDLYKMFIAALVVKSEMVKVDGGILKQLLAKGLGAGAIHVATQLGIEALRGIPIASIFGAVVQGSKEAYDARNIRIELNHLVAIIEISEADPFIFASELARKITYAMRDNLIHHLMQPIDQHESGFSVEKFVRGVFKTIGEWVDALKYFVAETLSGDSRNEIERLAGDKVIEIVAYVTAGKLKGLTTREAIVNSILSFLQVRYTSPKMQTHVHFMRDLTNESYRKKQERDCARNLIDNKIRDKLDEFLILEKEITQLSKNYTFYLSIKISIFLLKFFSIATGTALRQFKLSSFTTIPGISKKQEHDINLPARNFEKFKNLLLIYFELVEYDIISMKLLSLKLDKVFSGISAIADRVAKAIASRYHQALTRLYHDEQVEDLVVIANAAILRILYYIKNVDKTQGNFLEKKEDIVSCLFSGCINYNGRQLKEPLRFTPINRRTSVPEPWMVHELFEQVGMRVNKIRCYFHEKQPAYRYGYCEVTSEEFNIYIEADDKHHKFAEDKEDRYKTYQLDESIQYARQQVLSDGIIEASSDQSILISRQEYLHLKAFSQILCKHPELFALFPLLVQEKSLTDPAYKPALQLPSPSQNLSATVWGDHSPDGLKSKTEPSSSPSVPQ